jgi:hypothetical protein
MKVADPSVGRRLFEASVMLAEGTGEAGTPGEPGLRRRNRPGRVEQPAGAGQEIT